jgi:hypothetical protein
MRHPEPGDHIEAHREADEGSRLVGQGVEQARASSAGGNIWEPEAQDQQRDRDGEDGVAEVDGAIETATALVGMS